MTKAAKLARQPNVIASDSTGFTVLRGTSKTGGSSTVRYNLELQDTGSTINTGGGILFSGNYLSASTDIVPWAGIGGFKESNIDGGGNGYLSLSTAPAGSVLYERIRVGSNGSVTINTPDSGYGLTVKSGSVNGAMYIRTATGSSAPALTISTGLGYDMAFTAAKFYVSTATLVGSITCSTTSTSYATSSDYRLKDNVQPMQNALATVAQLNPVTYTWKSDGSTGQGFIAHELQAVVPDCVTGAKDEVDAEGNPVYQGIDTSFLIATLTKAVQELTAKVEALEASKGVST